MNIFLRLLPFILALEIIFCYGSFAAQTYQYKNVNYSKSNTSQLQIKDLSHRSNNYFSEFLEIEEEIEESEEFSCKKSNQRNSFLIKFGGSISELDIDKCSQNRCLQDKSIHITKATTPFFILYHTWKLHV